MYLRCIAEGHNGQWEAVCLDFDLAVQGQSFEDVRRRMAEAVTSYLECVSELSESEKAQFLSRKAPWHMRLRFAWHLFWHILRDGGDSNSASFSLPAPAH